MVDAGVCCRKVGQPEAAATRVGISRRQGVVPGELSCEARGTLLKKWRMLLLLDELCRFMTAVALRAKQRDALWMSGVDGRPECLARSRRMRTQRRALTGPDPTLLRYQVPPVSSRLVSS